MSQCIMIANDKPLMRFKNEKALAEYFSTTEKTIKEAILTLTDFRKYKLRRLKDGDVNALLNVKKWNPLVDPIFDEETSNVETKAYKEYDSVVEDDDEDEVDLETEDTVEDIDDEEDEETEELPIEEDFVEEKIFIYAQIEKLDYIIGIGESLEFGINGQDYSIEGEWSVEDGMLKVNQ